jgi:glycosyltransferase involved in cell wall biosynthesis
MQDIKLDVLMITYNHEDYIEEAINSVINQVTDFIFRLLIFDDCSTDNTEERINNSILHDNPNLIIEYHRNTENLGMSVNGMQSFNSARAKYISICEGDDYWIDRNKLQKQVDFLEKNPQIILTCGNCIQVNEIGDLISEDFLIKQDTILETKNVIGDVYYNFIPTASILFRNIINEQFLIDLKKLKAYDWSLLFLLSLKGNFYFDKTILSAYRITGKGVSSSLSDVEKLKMSILLYDLFRFYEPKFETLINNKVDYCFELIKYIYNNEKNTLVKDYEYRLETLNYKIKNLEEDISFSKIIIILLKKIKKKIRSNYEVFKNYFIKNIKKKTNEYNF